MAPIRRFLAEEKGKAPREGLEPLPPKKRPVPDRGDEVARPETSRPWYERPPPGIPLPLYARAEDPGEYDAEVGSQERTHQEGEAPEVSQDNLPDFAPDSAPEPTVAPESGGRPLRKKGKTVTLQE